MTVANNDTITWIPSQTQANANRVEIRVTDPHGTVDEQAYTIHVKKEGYPNLLPFPLRGI